VSGIAVEALLGQRLDLGAHCWRACSRKREDWHQRPRRRSEDVMFAADLKRAFSDVLKAKQEGQAALERARGESASLRNLANAARVLEGNPAADEPASDAVAHGCTERR